MTERHSPLQLSPLEIEADIETTLGERALPQTIVVGSTAVYLALEGKTRQPNDIDLSVAEAAYPHVRERLLTDATWKEQKFPDGRPRLTNGTYDISIGWENDLSHDALDTRGWRTSNGLGSAGLTDVYPQKDQRNLAKDKYDKRVIRERLHDVSLPPLPEAILQREIQIASASLPEALANSPGARESLWLAANGLYTVFTLYGDPDVKRANQIIGDLELEEYFVPALYHNGFDLPESLQHLKRHFDITGASNQDRLDGMIGDAYADAIYGNGRESDKKPGGHDELRSARLTRAHALQLGFSPKRAERLYNIVLGTGFNEKTRLQIGKNSSDPVVRAVSAVDLQGFTVESTQEEPRVLIENFAIVAEDLISARFSPRRPLGRLLISRGIRVTCTEDVLQFIDQNSRLKSPDEPNGLTIREEFTKLLRSKADFHENHEYPEGWTGDNLEARRNNATILRAAADAIDAGASTLEMYKRAQAA